MQKQVNSQIKDKFYSLIAEGVEKFPNNPYLISNTDQTTHSNQDPYSTISNCSLCALAKSRKKVLISSEIVYKKFFILSEFPETEDEQSSTVYSDKSSSGLILKLVEKLGLFQDCHFSFALKCVPEKGIPQGSLSICVQNNLKKELQAVNPEAILCFGQKALLALAHFDKSLLLAEENSLAMPFEFENRQKSVFFLASSRDLQAFPQWRNQVWSCLENFKVKKQ